ncbi:MAG: 5-formyltetrahydrofolate cyclo-ligase [Alphaproteobacteria bacterium]|nr:5-formyltetrahydrofolate cyclo-ligase [Alphaproteobacteria bacterium]
MILPVDIQKNFLRKKCLDLRKQKNMVNLSKEIVSKIISWDKYISSKKIMIFYPISHEINLLALLKDTNKKFYLPRIHDNTLLCCPFSNENHLKRNKSIKSIFEPITEPIDKNEMDIIFIPALATDQNFNRLGYGKGFYDKFLRNCSAIKVIPTYKDVFFQKIPTTAEDISADVLVFPEKIIIS